jgi:hypothetical protein
MAHISLGWVLSSGIKVIFPSMPSSQIFSWSGKSRILSTTQNQLFSPKGQIVEAGDSFRPSPLEDGFQPLLSLAEATSSSSTLLVSMLSETVSVPKDEAIGRAWAKNISGTFLLVVFESS